MWDSVSAFFFDNVAADQYQACSGAKSHDTNFTGLPSVLNSFGIRAEEGEAMNPYLNRVMIQDPKQFHGRRSEVRRILSRIGAERPQSVSLVGDRRIGKSSLLFYLTFPDAQAPHVQNVASLITVFLDFQQLRNITLEDFFVHLLVHIRRKWADAPEIGPPGYWAFQGLLESLRRQQKKLILLFDEFQAITTNAAFNAEFFSYLRSMANHYEVAYVTSSNIELQRLCYSSDISDSPFFNIFSNFYLRPFDRADACDLIMLPSAEQGVPLAGFQNEIIELAGLFPFYLQIACSLYFDAVSTEPSQRPRREEILGRFLEESTPHFDYFWEHSTPECQALLEKVSRGESMNPEEMYLGQELQRRGYLVQRGERTEVYSPIFADYIRKLACRTVRTIQDFSSGGSGSLGPGVRVNQYLILRKAGEGGMGVVYEAEDTALCRKVALKFIRPILIREDAPRKRFLQEARAAACLNHPAIAAVHELFEHGKHFGLAMDWIDGSTLKACILKSGRIALAKLICWMIEACEGLEAAHRKGIIHRDINPSNLMINLQERLIITDFGLAHSQEFGILHGLASITATGELLGTLDYMSPEQACGIAVDCRSDLFSLGVVIFEALTGELPFQGKTAYATLEAIANKPVPSVSRYGISRHSRIDRLIRRLLAKSPSRRHADASELKEDLRALLPGQGP